DSGEIHRLAADECDDAVDGALHLGRRRGLARRGKTPAHARSRARRVPLGQLHAENAVLAPGDGAASDGRIEQRETRFHHAASPYQSPAAGLVNLALEHDSRKVGSGFWKKIMLQG